MGFMDLATLVLIIAALVLLVKNPKGSSSLISSGGGFVQGETTILTGSGYKGGA